MVQEETEHVPESQLTTSTIAHLFAPNPIAESTQTTKMPTTNSNLPGQKERFAPKEPIVEEAGV